MNVATVERMIDRITDGIYTDYPQLLERYGESGKAKCREDNQHHFRQLHTAYTLKNDQIFIDYALWLNGILTSRGMEAKHLIDNFERIEKSLLGIESTEETEVYLRILKEVNQTLAEE